MIYFFSFLDRLMGVLMGLTFITVRIWGQCLMALGSLTGISLGPGTHLTSVLVLCRFAIFCTCHCCLLLLTWEVIFFFFPDLVTLVLFINHCPAPDLGYPHWGQAAHWIQGLTSGSPRYHEPFSWSGLSWALAVLPSLAQRCLQAQFQDHFYK